MADYRVMFDSLYIGAWDLNGKEATVTIERVEAGTLIGSGGRKSRKPLVHFKGKDRPLALNKTNAKIIAGMYGADTAQWAGKAITIYPTKTEMAGETVDCVRVRNVVPK